MKFSLVILFICFAALTSAKSVDIERCNYWLQFDSELAPEGVWENIQECATGVVESLLALGADLTESTNGAVQNVLKFKDLVMICYNEPSKTAQLKCVVTNVRDFKDCLSQIMNDTTEIISVLKDQGEALINAIKSCHLNDQAPAFYEIANKIEKCY